MYTKKNSTIKLHQSSICSALLLHLLILLDIVVELVHLTFFVFGLLATLLLLALRTGLAVFAAFAFLAVVAVMTVEDAFHEVLLVGFCGNELATGSGERSPAIRDTLRMDGWMDG